MIQYVWYHTILNWAGRYDRQPSDESHFQPRPQTSAEQHLMSKKYNCLLGGVSDGTLGTISTTPVKRTKVCLRGLRWRKNSKNRSTMQDSGWQHQHSRRLVISGRYSSTACGHNSSSTGPEPRIDTVDTNDAKELAS